MNFKKAVLFCLIFLTLFYCLNVYMASEYLGTVKYAVGDDYIFHYNASAGKRILTDETHSAATYERYPYFSHLIMKPFSFREETFYIFYLFLIAFVIPLLLFKISGKELIIFFYFTTINLFYIIEATVPLAEVFLLVLLLIFIITKNTYLKILILLLALITHSAGFWLILITFILLLLTEEKKINLKGFLVCFPILTNKPEILTATLHTSKMNLTTIVNFFTQGFPLPLFLISLKQLINEKDYFKIGMVAVGIVFAILSTRTLHLTQLFLLFGLTNYYEKTSKPKKIIILFIVFIVFLIQLWGWHRLKLSGYGVLC